MFTDKGIFKRLKEDHEEVSSLMEKLAGMSEDDPNRAKTFATIRDELLRHSEAEDQIFYAKLRQHEETRDQILESKEEHKVIEKLLRELDRNDETSDQWTAKFEVLKENVEHHVEEEENELFPKAKKVIDKEEAERLGEDFEREKRSLSR